MAKLFGFDPTQHEEVSKFSPIPEGQYIAMITDSEMRETIAGDGEYLKLTFEIIDGAHSGRMVWTNLNLRNKNPKAVEIAKRNLASICRAIHRTEPLDDSDDLHNKAMKIKVTIREAQNGYEASNEIKGYATSNDGPPQVASASASGGVTPPWANQGKAQGNKDLPF